MELTDDDLISVTDLLDSNLARLVTGDGEHFSTVSIKNITKQVVAGLKYEVTGTFKMGKNTTDCVVTLWTRSWLEDMNERVKLKADCGGETVNTQNDTGTW